MKHKWISSKRGGPRDYTPGHASFSRMCAEEAGGQTFNQGDGREWPSRIIYEKKRRGTSTVHFFASRRSQTNPRRVFPLLLLPLPRRLWRRVMIFREVDRKNENSSMCRPPLCSTFPSNSAILARMSENALRWPLYPFRLRHFMRSLFFSFTTFLDSNRATRSSFDVCISIMCVCMCVCGCVQEDWCVFRDEETGGWFRWKSRGIIRRIDEQNIFPSSFDRYYVLEFFDILEYWNRDAWEVWVLRCWRWNEIILHAWCGFIGHLHVNS